MTPDVAVSLATFVIVLLLLSRLGSAKPAGVEVDPDVELARQFVRTKIDEHAEALAERYLNACEQDGRGDCVPGSFGREVERFIGDILLHDVEFEHPGLGPAVRELVTLEREHIYALILSRVQTT